MSSGPDWIWWLVAALLVAGFAWYFWHAGRSIWKGFRAVIDTIQNWPQVRRAMAEAEARGGGRYPFWLRAVRGALVLAMIGLVSVLLWRKFS